MNVEYKKAGDQYEVHVDGEAVEGDKGAFVLNRFIRDLKNMYELEKAQKADVVAEHEELTTDHLILKTELALKDKKLGEMLAEDSQ